MTPALSVLVVTYKSGADVDTCLALLAASRIDRPYEVIVVDNASGDGTAERIAAAWPDIRVIAETTNHGFAGANAIAYAAARACLK
ncbi:glycosyltransferase [Methylobacterium sp. WL122]|nr:glycosyltransferase [Methylobacterium sp. WL122]